MFALRKCHGYASQKPWLRFVNAMVALRKCHGYNPQVMMF